MESFFLTGSEADLSPIPSKAIRQCLEDLRMVEKDPRYIVNMYAWHKKHHIRSTDTTRCSVCLGGARLARIIDDPDYSDVPNFGVVDFSKIVNETKQRYRISSMDDFRCGHIAQGLHRFFRGKDFGYFREMIDPNHIIRVPEYSDDREGWYEGMEEVIQILEKVGL